MSETNLNALNLEELKKQADILQIKYASNIGEEALRKKLAEALGIVGDDTDDQSGTDEQKTEKTVTVLIGKDPENKQPVPLGVNGRIIRVRRGEKVQIPAEFLDCLKNAVRMEWDAEAEEMIEVPAYNFQAF